MTDLAARVRAAAVLEGDFLLRSGRRSRFYVDKYRFGTRPDLLAEIGDALAERIAEVEPGATRIAAPEVGAIALAAAASLRSGLPFVIVRKAPKVYGTSQRLEGVYEAGSASSWSRTSSPRAARPSTPCTRCARRSWCARP